MWPTQVKKSAFCFRNEWIKLLEGMQWVWGLSWACETCSNLNHLKKNILVRGWRTEAGERERGGQPSRRARNSPVRADGGWTRSRGDEKGMGSPGRESVDGNGFALGERCTEVGSSKGSVDQDRLGPREWAGRRAPRGSSGFRGWG